MKNQDFARFAKNRKVILDRLKIWKFEGAPQPKYESRWPNFLHELLIYIYFKDSFKKLPQNNPEDVVYRGVRIQLPPGFDVAKFSQGFYG